MGLTIRKVEFVIQLVLFKLLANHLEEVYVCRTCSYYTVNNGVTGKLVVNQQRVRGRDITMYLIIIHTIAVCVIIIILGCRNHLIQIPCGLIVCLDSWLHQQCTTQHVGHITIQTLHILVGIGKTHTVLIGVRINKTGTELDKLGLHHIVHTSGETLIVRTCTL